MLKLLLNLFVQFDLCPRLVIKVEQTFINVETYYLNLSKVNIIDPPPIHVAVPKSLWRLKLVEQIKYRIYYVKVLGCKYYTLTLNTPSLCVPVELGRSYKSNISRKLNQHEPSIKD